MVSNREIINYFFSTSHGIRQTARYFSLSKIYVSKVILRYKKLNEIR